MRNLRSLSPSDKPVTRIVWLFGEDDRREVEALVGDGWRVIDRREFSGRERIELSSKPEPPAPTPEPPPREGGRKTRNRRHNGPLGAFVRGHKARAWVR